MPPITLSSISNTNIKVRWKEPYASEGLNRKLAVVVPSGVYRGLKLGVSATNLSVDLLADAAGDHVAVHENQLGFSTTYVDDTSGTITLPLTGFLTNDVVVICLYVVYTSGASTTALFRGYELSEYEALSAAAQQDLVVLGTVLRPAAGIIPAINITHDRRKIPFLQRTDEATPWNPLIRNGGFELGQTNGTYRHASPFWTTTTTNANFTIRPVTTEVHSGAKSLEMTTGVAGTVIATIQQDLWMPVTPGRYVMGRLYKKVILAPSLAPPPTGRMRFLFGDLDGTNDVQEDLIFDISAVDGSFEEGGGIVKVPVTARVLKAVQIILDATYAGTGPCIRLDDVQAWAQVDGANWLDVLDSRAGEGAFGRLFLGTANSFATAGAQLSNSGNLVEIERSDSNLLANPPAISIQARASVSFKYTLVSQSLPPGNPGYRKYVSRLGNLLEVVNASYNAGTDTWTKDVPGVNALRNETASTGMLVYERVSDVPWLDSAWAAQFTVGTAPTFSQPATFQQAIRHADRSLQLGSNWFQYDTTGIGDDSVFRNGGFIQIMSATTIWLELPLIVGDRVNSFSIQVNGNGVIDISAIRFQRAGLGSTFTELTTALTPPLGWFTYSFALPGGETLGAGESFEIEFVITGTMQLATSTIVYDHPV
jgi:hypothetical protein